MIKFSSIMCLTLHQTPDKAEPSLVPVPCLSSSSLERETWKRGRVEPPDTNYKALKNQRFPRQSPNASYSSGFHNRKKQRFLRIHVSWPIKHEKLTRWTADTDVLLVVSSDLHPKSNLMEIRLCPQASNETSHRSEKPAIFKNIYKHKSLAILEL